MAVKKVAEMALVSTKTYRSEAAGVQLFEVNSARAKNMPDELDDIIIAKMKEIDPEGFARAYSDKDGNYLVGLAAAALVALKVREKTNKNDGYMVEMIQKVGGGQKGWAWCMYMMMACIGIAETLTGIKSPIITSGSCADVRKAAAKTPEIIIEFAQSIFGAIWIKKYSDGTGHTGAFEKWIKAFTSAFLLEGNTTAGKVGDKVVREGGGSYRTERELDSSWVMCLLPFPVVGHQPPAQAPDVADQDGIPEFGEHSDRVATMQVGLNRHGSKLKVDGKFGPMTKVALSKFQKENGLPGSGIPGPKTMALLAK